MTSSDRSRIRRFASGSLLATAGVLVGVGLIALIKSAVPITLLCATGAGFAFFGHRTTAAAEMDDIE